MELGINEIIVGERRREDFGDIAGLADSIEQYGLLQPIVVDSERNLVAGERRLRACQKLGWDVVPVRDVGTLTLKERRAIELEENLRRKDLTPYERSKTLADLAETAREVLREEFTCADCGEFFPRAVWHCSTCNHHWPPDRETCWNCHEGIRPEPDFSSEFDEKSGRGRPSKPDSEDRVAEMVGVPRPTIVIAEQHAATAEQYPFMQNPHWSQAAVLQAKRALEKMDEGERDIVVGLITEARDNAKLGVEIAEKVFKATPEERGDFFRLAQSEDERERDQAATWAASRDPMPDPRLTVYRKCVLDLRASLKRFPNDEENGTVENVIVLLEGLVATIRGKGKIGQNGTVGS